MSDWLWLVIGAVIWQFVCFIVFVVTNENEEATIYTAVGILMIPIVIFGVTFRMVRLQYFKYYYDSYFLIHNNCSVSNHIYISKHTAQQFNFDNTKEYYIKKISEGRSWKSIPYKQDVYHGEKVFKGHMMDLYKKEK